MNKSIQIIFITFLSFGIHRFLIDNYFKKIRFIINDFIPQLGINHILTYIIVGAPIFIAVLLIKKEVKLSEKIGLHKSLLKGFLIGLLCALPMFIGYALVFNYNVDFGLNDLLVRAVSAGLFEEIYFRAFLFGMLFRYTRIGFIPAIILGSLYFGFLHVGQSKDLGEMMGIFGITFMGAILFAWLYVEWDYNIWVPIFLHLFMNLSWALFSAGDTALGGVYSNVFRVMTIALSIIGTLIYKRKNKIPIGVNKTNLILKS